MSTIKENKNKGVIMSFLTLPLAVAALAMQPAPSESFNLTNAQSGGMFFIPMTWTPKSEYAVCNANTPCVTLVKRPKLIYA